MKIDKYRNKFYNKAHANSLYEYIPNYEPIEYKGFYIFERILCFDVVEKQDDEFVCISQVGSIRYAKAFIDHGCVHGNYTA
jgi:hypothetical protein